MINVIIHDLFVQEISEDKVRMICQKVFDSFELKNSEITIIFESDSFIQHLNLSYRGIDDPTDVLSFDINHIDPETDRRYLGDVIISVETAKRQAESHKASLDDEITLLIVHGMLHLLGFDHAMEEEQKEMWIKQRSILDQLEISSHLPFD